MFFMWFLFSFSYTSDLLCVIFIMSAASYFKVYEWHVAHLPNHIFYAVGRLKSFIISGKVKRGRWGIDRVQTDWKKYEALFMWVKPPVHKTFINETSNSLASCFKHSDSRVTMCKWKIWTSTEARKENKTEKIQNIDKSLQRKKNWTLIKNSLFFNYLMSLHYSVYHNKSYFPFSREKPVILSSRQNKSVKPLWHYDILNAAPHQ